MNINNITPELCDSILRFFVENVPYGEVVDFDSHEMPIPTPDGLSSDALDALIGDFENEGYINICGGGASGSNYTYGIQVNRKAIDFMRRGGFVGQEVVFKQNLEKLLLEIEQLKPSNSAQAERLTTIAANLASFFGLAV